MKIITNSFPQRVMLLVFFALLAVAQLSPLASNYAMPGQADLVNHVAAIIQAAINLTTQFPLRIMPTHYQGWSYPFFQFYAPTSYTFAGFIYRWLTPENPYIAYKITIWLALMFGAIYMYRLCHWLTKSSPAALIASTIFLTAPYFNILVGALGAFNEIIAICLVPFVLYYTLRDYEDPSRIKNLLLTSLGWYALITIHIVTFIYATVLISLFFFLLTLKNKKWLHLIRAFIAIGFSCILATWYLIPVVQFGHLSFVSESFPNDQFVFNSSPSLASMLSPTLSKILNMQQNVVTRAHMSIGIPILAGVAVAIFAIMNNHFLHKKTKFDYLIFPLVLLFAIAFFLLWSPVNVWSWVPKSFLVIQYTMRMLAQICWIGPIICAWSICWLFDNKLNARHTVLGIVLVFAATNSLLPSLPTASTSISDIIKKPFITFNPSSYLLDPKFSTDFVKQIDNYQLDTLIFNHKFVYNVDYIIPKALIQLSPNTMLHIEGYVLNKNKKNTYILEVIADKQVIASKTLQQSGALSWNIPANSMVDKAKKDLIPVHLKLRNADKQHENALSDLQINADRAELTGYLNPKEVIPVAETPALCKTEKDKLHCNIKADQNIKLIELPMFYYPNLLKIKLNGKPIDYQGILTDGIIITGIIPEQGKMNHITAKFVGLPWANLASTLGWILWLILALYQTIIWTKKTIAHR